MTYAAIFVKTPDQWRNRGSEYIPFRDFPPGKFWRLIGKNQARKKGNKIENVEENEEKRKREAGNVKK